MTHITDEDIRRFAAIPRSILDDVIAATVRMPPEWWTDLVADLEQAERRSLPGTLTHEMHHDARGIVHRVKTNAERNRQRVSVKKAS